MRLTIFESINIRYDPNDPYIIIIDTSIINVSQTHLTSPMTKQHAEYNALQIFPIMSILVSALGLGVSWIYTTHSVSSIPSTYILLLYWHIDTPIHTWSGCVMDLYYTQC